MSLLFTPSQFFQVFAAYNHAVWPAQYLLLLMAVATVVLVVRVPRRAAVFSAAFVGLWLLGRRRAPSGNPSRLRGTWWSA